jgi:hypothetical protein
MPRPSPSTRADIEARRRLTGLPVDAEANELPEGGITPIMRRFAACWDFSAALDTLGIRDQEDRRRCEDWLVLICVTYDLIRRAEEQETPGRKARALQLAPRWQKKRMQEQKLFWRKARNADKQLAEQALRLWKQTPWLPQPLEQEAVRALETREREEGRELDHIPQSRDDFAPLREQMKQMARRGRYKSWALRNTIHALQVCATTFKKKLIWEEGCHAPPGLIKFLVEALGAANIQHPNPEEHYSTFVDLMLRPRKLTERQIERMEQPPKPSKAGRRLAKVFL